MDIISNIGRTAIVFRVGAGLAGKMPRDMQEGLPGREEFTGEIDNAFAVEEKLFKRLGGHPRIFRYHGHCTIKGMKDGLLLSEANGGDLQSYIEEHDAEIDDALRRKWSYQVAQAVAHLHKNGIIHSNLSTTNVLVHQTSQSLDVLLADFGGSRCVELNLDGGLLPDDPFNDPCLMDYYSPKVDVFSLGVLIYIIMTGHYPFWNGPAPRGKERLVYGDYVRALFETGVFPKLSTVSLGNVIAGCCCERSFDTAKDVVEALKIEIC